MDVKRLGRKEYLRFICDTHPDTPVNRKGMSLSWIVFELYDVADGTKLGTKTALPSYGTAIVHAPQGKRAILWRELTPGKSIRVRLVAYPLFSYLKAPGDAVLYGIGNRGRLRGGTVESRKRTLSMDEDGNLKLK